MKLRETTSMLGGADTVTAEYYQTPGQAAQRVHELRGRGIHAWRTLSADPRSVDDLAWLATVACYKLPFVAGIGAER